MGIPRDKDAKRFYIAADHRRVDAAFLLEAERTTAAVYLAGYCVECVLKALIIAQAPTGRKKEVLEEFRGSGAHNYDWLRFMYHKHGGPSFPKDVVEAFVIVRAWGTDMRYEPSTTPADDAEEFLSAVQNIWQCADGRF